MKYSILIILLFLSISSKEIKAQNVYDDFFLSFNVIGERLEGDKKLFKAELLNKSIIIDKGEVGSIMPIYIPNSKKEVKYIGEVKLYEDDKDIVIVELENTKENNALMFDNKALIKIRASLGDRAYLSLPYHMNRLNVGMWDVTEERDLLKEYEINEYSSLKGNELKILERLKEESKYVAGEMRGQMNSPKITEGRFKPLDLFTAMEIADSWDIRSFLLFVKEQPYKYQGTTWKFSEIFATWIHEGAPTTFGDLREIAGIRWKEKDYLLRLFEDAKLGITKKVLDEIRSEAGDEIDAENFARAELLLENAMTISEDINDEIEIAWTNYKKGKLLSDQGDNEGAVALYEKSIATFKKEKIDVGVLLAGNDLGDTYNQLGGKSNYKKAIESLEKSIERTDQFGKDNEGLSPVTGLMYRNLGDSYMGLKKYKKALGIYQTALTYTEFSTTTALKRKASILLKISETYEILEKEDLEEDYLNKAMNIYKKYEAALAKVKKT